MAAPMEASPKKRNVKRKKDEKQDDSETVQKKIKEDVFNEIEFKFLLKDANTKFKGLEKFLQAARDWSDGEGEDIVKAYCRSSPECSEIFQVLEAGSKKLNELQLVFDCLEKILLRIADDLDKFHTTGQTIVRKLLTNHAHSIFFTLNVQNRSTQIKTGLKLLVAMVMLGASTAKLVLNNVDLGHKTMLPLLHRRDSKDEEDVRTCFLHLILACLLAGDNDVIRKLVQIKGLMENVFQGMEYDRTSLLQLVLSTILEKVIMNSGVSKTAKMQMFSEKSLKELGHLYNWQGPARWKMSIKNKGKQQRKPEAVVDDEESEDRTLVAEVADKFLTELCTSYKHGIIFFDKSYGLSGRSQNRLMTSFLSYLSGQLNHTLVQKLVVAILTACPDQLQYFLPHVVHSLVPRETTQWISSMRFLMKIYNSLQRDVSSMRMKEKKELNSLVDILLVYTLPATQVLNTVLPGVKDKSLVVSHVTLSLVRQIADTAVHILKSVQQMMVYTDVERTEICNSYRALVLKSLPEVMLVFGCWDKTKALQPLDRQKLTDFCGVQVEDVYIQIEQILCLYQALHPNLLGEHPHILGKLLEGIMGNENEETSLTQSHMTKVYLLKLMAGTETKKLPWAKQNVKGRTLLYQLLELVIQLSTSPDLADLTLNLVCKLFESTGQFEGHTNDLRLWLKVIQNSDLEVLEFVSKVMITYIHNPYPYMDRLCDLDLQPVTMETERKSSQQIGIDDVLKMDLTDLERDAEIDQGDTVNRRFPFCPILIAALENAEKTELVSQVIRIFVSQVVLQTFHQQVHPEPLCKLLQQFEACPLLPKLQDYITSWLKFDGDKLHSHMTPTQKKYRELVEENGEVVNVDHNALQDIQQDLLHLSYIIHRWTKTGEKKCLKLLQSLQTSIVSKMKEVAQTKQSVDSESREINAELDNSDHLQLETEDPVSSAARLVLEHPVVKHYFLFATNDNQSTKIVNTVTEFVIEILQVLDISSVQQQNIVEYYFNRALSCLEQKYRNEETNVVDMLLIRVVSILVSHITDDQCNKMFDLALNVVAGLLGSVADHVGPMIGHFIQRLLKSHCKAVKMTKSGIGTLINSFIENASVENSELLIRFFKKFPVLAASCPSDIVGKLLQSTEHLSLVEFVMENNSYWTLEVGELILSAELDWTSANYMHLVTKYICLTIFVTGSQGAEKVCKKIVKLFRDQILSLCGEGDVNHVKGVMELIRHLSTAGLLGEKLISKMKRKVLATLESGDGEKLHHIDLLCILYGRDKCKEQEQYSTAEQEEFIHVCVRCLLNVINKNNPEVEDRLLDIIGDISQEDVDYLTSQTDFNSVWPKLSSSILENAFTIPAALKFLNKMITTIYKRVDLDPGVTMETIFNTVTNNSLYVSVMFDEHGASCKDMLVDLLLEVIQTCPSVCSSDHISVFLGAYSASLTQTDQKLLKLMHFYEKNDISFTNYRPFLWSEKAKEQHTLRLSLGSSLKRASTAQVMANIDGKKLTNSILHFPLRKKLQDVEVLPAESYKSEASCYDPSFLLPLLSHLLEPESVIDCRKFTESGCLGYTLAALSSHNEHMRNAAQHILEKFQGHLEAAKFPEREQLQYLLYILQNSMPGTKNKLPSIITQFLARVARLMLKPDDHMYTVINSYLLLKPSLDTGNIPEFFMLFNSSHMQYKVERTWMLSLLHDGLRETADYWIFEKLFTFKLLKSFYDSSMSDTACEIQVLKIVKAACTERRLAIDLCQNHGLLAWIALTISKLSVEKQQVCECICDLLHTLWSSVMGHSTDEKLLAQLSFPVQILACYKSISCYLGDISEASKLTFLNTVSLVLNHLHSMADSIRGHMTQTVSHIEVLLLLLHCQKNWTQSTGKDNTMKRILASTGFDVTVLEKKSRVGRKSEPVVAQGNKGQEVEKDVTDEMETEESTKDVDKADATVTGTDHEIVDKIVSICNLWIADRGDTDTSETAAVDVIVISWLIDIMKTEKGSLSVFNMVKLITNIILSKNEGSENSVLNYLARKNAGGDTTVVDLVNVYSIVAKRFQALKVEEKRDLEPKRKEAVKQVNDVLTEVYCVRQGTSSTDLEEAVTRKLGDQTASGDEDELKSVALRQMFIETFLSV